MNNNSYKFTLPKGDDKYINIPIEIKWDFLGQDDAVEEYQQKVVEEVIGIPGDFEVLRFAHAPYNNGTKTDIKYDFHFFSDLQLDSNGDLVPTVPVNPSQQVLTSSATDWVSSYIPEGFTAIEIYYYVKMYGTTGLIMMTPSFKLDYVGDKEGFFLYWLRNTKFLDISKFYMTAKFFDARLGIFVKMTNTPQSLIPSKFTFNPEDYFYYEVRLNYNEKTNEVWDNNNRVGTTSSIKWYEYINP